MLLDDEDYELLGFGKAKPEEEQREFEALARRAEQVREAQRKYAASPEGLAAHYRYDKTEAGKEAKRRYNAGKGRASRAKYAQTEKGRTASRKAAANYRLEESTIPQMSDYDVDALCDDAESAVSDLVEFARKSEERGYNRGTEEAFDMYKKEPLDDSKADDLKARYEYLKHGGRWQIDPDIGDYEHAEDYVRGFLDAMRVLGVKP